MGLEVVEIVSVRCNLVDNQYQQKSEVLYTLTLNTFYAYLLNVEPRNLVFLKTWNTEFDEIIITFTDQNGRTLEIKEKINLTFLINKNTCYSIEPRTRKYVYDMDFCHSRKTI